MLSLCNSTPFLRLSKPPLLPPFQHVHRSTPKLLPHRLKFPAGNASSSAMDFPSNSQPQQLRPRTPFPGGFKRPEIKIPTLVLQLDCEEVLRKDGTLDAVDVALSKWIGIIILSCGEESRGGQLYEAACVLKSVIRDRAYLLISERVDIAAAVGASGVILSDKGLPAIVARNMMMESKAGSVVLPLVARTVETAKSALAASSSEGADFLILGIDRAKHAESFLNAVCEHVKVPVFIMIDLVEDATCFGVVSELIQSGASGIVVCMKDIKLLTDDNLNKLFSTIYAMNSRAQDVFKAFNRGDKLDVDKGLQGKRRVSGFYKDKERQFIEVERPVLLEAINFIRKAAPQMEEVSLLVDAVSRLDDPFLLVIVGEFNSGKSTVINALLGRRYLKEGVVPTTNEITLLCYSEMNSSEQERCERHPDGQFICYLPAPILKEMNLVDTPGTNVILQRQQRLTEEFVPRADLLLFVMSADRPLTESEVAFLRYVQQWKKKVVFILNKSDIYQNISELEEATSFIKENTRKLLNTEHVTVYPVSARLALKAKLSAPSHIGVDYEKFLSNDPNWRHSSFHEFEDFLFSFLDGSTDAGIERMKLKLETPIGIANRILTSCESFVRQEFEYANQDLMSIRDTINSLKEYAMKMENESTSWRKQILSLIERAKARAVNLMESSLQLSNLDLIATSFFKGEKSNSMRASLSVQNEIVGPALSDAQRLIVEYLAWLQSCNAREERRYKESFEKRWPAFVNNTDLACSEDCELIRRKKELSFQVTENFSPSAAAKLLDQEIREVVFGTFGGLGAAGLSASLLTSVLPSTLEDLLALGLCSAGGLLAISSFPNRRKELTDKVKRAADALARELEEAMIKDLSEALENLEQWVEFIARPYQDAAQRRLNQMLSLQEELSNVEKKIQALQIEIQNLHVLESV